MKTSHNNNKNKITYEIIVKDYSLVFAVIHCYLLLLGSHLTMEDWDMEIGTRRHEFYNGILFISLVSPLPETDWDATPLRPIKWNKFTPLTQQQIADFFSLLPGTKTFKEFIQVEMQYFNK